MNRPRILLVAAIAAGIGAATSFFFRDDRAGRIIRFNEVVGIGETKGQLVTLLDYLESGRRLARAYLKQQPTSNGATLSDVADNCSASCVRVEVEVAYEGGAVAVVHGSGVIVAGGDYVLTAGHAFHAVKVLAIRVILTDGRSIRATLKKEAYRVFNSTGKDWAVLKLVSDGPRDLVALKLGEAKKGEPVIALGYPDQIGVNEQGCIAYSREAPLAPLLFPARVSDTDPITLTPEAGAVPLGGMSGGPVVNAACEVVGIFVSTTRTPESNAMRISYGATPVAAPKRVLDKD